MPDRQTDRHQRGTWWSVTGYHEDVDKLQGNQGFPEWIKECRGQFENCPTTGTLHFQCAIQTVRQVRWKQIHDWIPKSHIELARDVNKLKNYVKKLKTALEGTYVELTNDTSLAPPIYLLPHQVMFKLAEAAYAVYFKEGYTFTDLHDSVKGLPTTEYMMNLPEDQQVDIQIDKTYSYTKLFQKLVTEDPSLARYCNSSSRNQWITLAPSFLRLVYDEKKKGSSCAVPSITHEESQARQDDGEESAIEDLEDLIAQE